VGKRKTILLFISVAILLLSCKDDTITNYTIPLDGSEIPSDLDTVQLQYNYILDLRYGRNQPFLKRENDFIFYEGGSCMFFKYNTTTEKWIGNYSFNNSENDFYNRSIFNNQDSIIILASKTSSGNFNLISLKPSDLSMKYLSKNIPLDGDLFYSTSTLYNNKLIVILHSSRKTLVIDLKTLSYNYILRYPFNVGNGDYYASLNGQYNGYFYFYVNRLKRFFKMNLDTYTFQEIPLPEYFIRNSDTFEVGGMIGNLFCFWLRNSFYTLCYDVDNNKWLNGGKSFLGLQFATTMVIYYHDNDAMYLNSGYSNSIIEIKRK